jgi:hypothetical protein
MAVAVDEGEGLAIPLVRERLPVVECAAVEGHAFVVEAVRCALVTRRHRQAIDREHDGRKRWGEEWMQAPRQPAFAFRGPPFRESRVQPGKPG